MYGSAQSHFPFGKDISISKPAPSIATKLSLFGQMSCDFEAVLVHDEETLTKLKKFEFISC